MKISDTPNDSQLIYRHERVSWMLWELLDRNSLNCLTSTQMGG